jgi:hypothetical protein
VRFPVRVVPAVAQQHGAAVHGRGILGCPDQGGEEWIADVQDHDADGSAVPCPQLPGGVVADETEFVDGLQYPVLGALGDAVGIVEDVGDRPHRNLRMGGDVLDAGCPRHSADPPKDRFARPGENA